MRFKSTMPFTSRYVKRCEKFNGHVGTYGALKSKVTNLTHPVDLPVKAFFPFLTFPNNILRYFFLRI